MNTPVTAEPTAIAVNDSAPSPPTAVDPETLEQYREALTRVSRTEVPFLVGGAYAFAHYTGLERWTKDLDLFAHPRDIPRLLDALAAQGLETELKFPHWLAKTRVGGECIDLIFSSGNGIARVDDAWFTYSVPTEILGVPVRLSPPEEMMWSKGFIMERERYDGADIAHLILACRDRLDWDRLVARFGPHWRVLLSHLALFGFIYPGERDAVPSSVLSTLSRRLLSESRAPAAAGRLCCGTLLSRQQYLADIHELGFVDARLEPHGSMTPDEVARWTAAIEEDCDAHRSRR
jgi:hypothetical protein